MGQAKCGTGCVCEAGVAAGAGDSVVTRAGSPHVGEVGCGWGRKFSTFHGAGPCVGQKHPARVSPGTAVIGEGAYVWGAVRPVQEQGPASRGQDCGCGTFQTQMTAFQMLRLDRCELLSSAALSHKS